MAGGQKTNPQSLIPNFALFTVRTPTAIVTDLGTEFGVEVSENGETSSHVFRGSVQLQPTGIAKGQETPGNTIILHANEAACVTLQADGKKHRNAQMGEENGKEEISPTLSRTEFNAAPFVRPDQMRQYAQEQQVGSSLRWRAYSRQLRKDPTLVAYYPFEQSDDASTSVLANQSAAGNALDGHVDDGEWVDGRFPGKVALHFRGRYTNDRVVLPNPKQFEFPGAFSIAVWFKTGHSNVDWNTLIAKGDRSWQLRYYMGQGNQSGHAYVSRGGNGRLSLDTYDANATIETSDYFQPTTGHTRIADGQWHLAVGVYEPSGGEARKRLYIDGSLDTENAVAMPRTHNDAPVWLGANGERGLCEFTGWIDEVAIFSRAVSSAEIAAMYQAGNPGEVASE
jgi:hypothetical protein